MDNETDDEIIASTCEPSHAAHNDGNRLSDNDQAVCWLVLKALSFKHGIHWERSSTHLNTVQPRQQGHQTVMPYMKCILVNIFMKKIIGEKCLRTARGNHAFTAAQHLVRDGHANEPNMECEAADRVDGRRQKSQNTQDWNLWPIMSRWLDRNTGYLRDGEVGVLGTECIVQRDNSAQEIQKAANNKIEEVGQALQQEVQQILEELHKSSDSDSMETIIQRVKQGQDSASKTPQEHAHSPGETQATSSSSTTSSSQPGKSDSETRSPPAAVPAPADNHTPATPVAAKPATVTPGAKASSGAGGGGSGGGPNGGPEAGRGKKGKKAATADNCDWNSIVEEWRKQMYVLRTYASTELKVLKDVLQQFTDYMEEKKDMMDEYGVNCENYGWDDISSDGSHHMGQKVADMMRCRLMSGALWFANGNKVEGPKEDGARGNVHMDETEERLRCEVANAFGYILERKFCAQQKGFKRGVKYAWKTMEHMVSSKYGTGQTMTGAVFERRCTECGYNIEKSGVRVVDGEMVDWLVRNGGIMDKIGNMENHMPCDQTWQAYKKSQGVTDQVQDISEKMPEVKQTEEEVRTETKKAVEHVKAIVERKIQEAEKKAKEPSKDAARATSPGPAPAPAPPPAQTTSGDDTGPPQPAAAPQSPPTAETAGAKAGGKGEAGPPAPNEAAELGTGGPEQSPNKEETNVTPKDDKGDAVVDGGNDDPPPLNPPKPQPNPNPDQSGSGGSSSGGDPGQAGQDGNRGEEGDPGTKAADQDEFSVKISLWGIGGPTSGSAGGGQNAGHGHGGDLPCSQHPSAKMPKKETTQFLT
ncbi:hypothetical protein AK88_05572 [Plasmodium fragile]|uniref:Schizont-infected cell agglutination extracellular alpha domain-containing protein n=1 Tax=Plasmodium fragile TaxID=5857 RepID=A0A0D9QCU0_PLAFR|nr:uncharacterized protein AK88_05572 [Plasmodium fragile]KJP84794.1 hypothetical protein AK88_05572 [Plasmodium fragile]